MTSHVLGIVYTHENNALLGATESYCFALRQAGFTTDIINLSKAEGIKHLGEQLARDDITFCFGLQGVGSRLESNGDILWSKAQIPFLCLHFDNPCYQPFNHYSTSPYVANLYQCPSFLDIQKRFIGGNQISGLLPFDLPEIHEPPSIPFAERPFKLMFLKSGGGVKEYVDYINKLPAPVRTGIWEILEQTQHNPNLLICERIDSLFTRLGYDRKKQEKDFWTVVQTMDFYIRRKRAIDFVNWLKFQDGAVIIGDGWEEIDKRGTQAQFLPAQKIEDAFEYYKRAQFVCNTNPYGSDLIHERIVWGLMMNACVITDTNSWWDSHFGNVPALIRFTWDRSLDEQLRPIVSDSLQAEINSHTGRPVALNHFVQHQTVPRMIAFADKIRKAVQSA